MASFPEDHWESAAAVLLTLTLAWTLGRSYVLASPDDRPEPQGREKALSADDPKFLAKISKFVRYDTAHRVYPSIRTIVRHGQNQSTSSDPIVVFIHGLGGSISQFEPVIRSISKSVTLFGIDFPGCGLSRFAPTSWDAYTQEALAELVRVAFFRTFRNADRSIVVIGHSMGCRVAQTFAKHSAEASPDLGGRIWPRVAGVVALCPDDRKFGLSEEILYGTLLTLPNPLLNFLRAIDRRGGIDSHSVTRFAGKAADRPTRELQLRFNEQSQTPVFRRVTWGILRGFIGDVQAWADLDPSIQLLFVAGKEDVVTPPSALERIEAAFKGSRTYQKRRHLSFKFLHGGHALPYDSKSYHAVAALIDDFLGDISEHMSMSWELQHSTAGSKWDVKNLEKWLSVTPVSPAIGKPQGIFRAMKTLRGVDEAHNPERFAREWSEHIKAVVDISQDVPVYDPELFSPEPIEYVKFATVSKIPPTKEQVRDFNGLVDSLRAKDIPGWRGDKRAGRDRSIGVHCHYGFNRTGFFICAYLIERCGYSIEDALAEFKVAKPPGIKHEHFIDQLYLRYESAEPEPEPEPIKPVDEPKAQEPTLTPPTETSSPGEGSENNSGILIEETSSMHGSRSESYESYESYEYEEEETTTTRTEYREESSTTTEESEVDGSALFG